MNDRVLTMGGKTPPPYWLHVYGVREASRPTRAPLTDEQKTEIDHALLAYDPAVEEQAPS